MAAETSATGADLMARWRRISPAGRGLMLLAAVLILANVIVALVSEATAGFTPSGPASSSLATGSTGFEGWADLLQRYDRHVLRLRQPLSSGNIPSGGTVVIADPQTLSEAEYAVLRSYLDVGGRVVAAGVATDGLLQYLLGPAAAPRWSSAPVSTATPVSGAPEVTGVSEVVSSGSGGSWSSVGRTEPLLTGIGGGAPYLATAASVGRGRLVMVADSSVFSNSLLASADNAQFALDIVGPNGRAVAFDEAAHGFGTSFGWGGLPLRAQWALIIAAIAALAWMWSRAWRFGPAELAGRPLPPPRRAYVDALATSLVRARPRYDAVAPVRAAVLERLAARAGVAPGAPVELLHSRAAEAGVPDVVVAAVTRDVQTDEDAVALGRALAWLEGSRS
jgi:hypothetical protein